MFKKIKLYFQMKRLERQMKFELVSTIYKFVAAREDFLHMIQQLPVIINRLSEQDITEMKSEIVDKIVSLADEKTQSTTTKEE